MCQKEGLPQTILKNRFETAPYNDGQLICGRMVWPKRGAASWMKGDVAWNYSQWNKRSSAGIVIEVGNKFNSNAREALIKSARADGERFWFQTRFGKWGNTLCISHFSNRSLGAKDSPLSRRRFIQSFPRICTKTRFRGLLKTESSELAMELFFWFLYKSDALLRAWQILQ